MVLTVYGIEILQTKQYHLILLRLQQHLPFTVLKLVLAMIDLFLTLSCNSAYRLRY